MGLSSRLLLLAIVAVAALAQQPCPFDCVTCDASSQTCETCASGFHLDQGRCHIHQCDRAEAHIGKWADGSDDARDATWTVTSADPTTETVVVRVFTPPRFECVKSGHALNDAIAWASWLNQTGCSGDSHCGPSAIEWTPVLMLGREEDDTLGYLELPINTNSSKSCVSAYRNAATDYTITDIKQDPTGLVTSWDPVNHVAILTLRFQELTDTSNPFQCVDEDNLGVDGDKFEFWQKRYYNNNDSIEWTFDMTLCYVDSIGQSVCPFSSPVVQMDVSLVTEGVSVATAGTVELLLAPKCQLYIRSAQIRYSGATIGDRDAWGEYEIDVTCEGEDYIPDLADIAHCDCEKDGGGNCNIYEESVSCDSTASTCTVTGMFKSTVFDADEADFLRDLCTTDDSLSDGDFQVEIAFLDNLCADTNDCLDLTNTKLFGSAPLKATDDLDTLAGMSNNSHEVYAGIMIGNDLFTSDTPASDQHQFNRDILVQTTVQRIVGADQKNSFVMCAMMQPTANGPDFVPGDIDHLFKISIREVDFTVTWATGEDDSTETLTDLLAGQDQWPAQWVWEDQSASAVRREILKRSTVRADAPCTPGDICEVSPLQETVESTTGWNHIQDNLDCVGISPFYLYSLLTLDDTSKIPQFVEANLTVFHEYQGAVTGSEGRRLLEARANGRNLLQAAGSFDESAPVFAEGTDTDVATGGVAWNVDNAEKEDEPADDSSPTIPMLPITIGLIAAGSCCFVFAGLAVWRKRHRTCAQCQKNLPLSNFSKEEIKLAGPKARCNDCVQNGSLDVVVTMSTGAAETTPTAV